MTQSVAGTASRSATAVADRERHPGLALGAVLHRGFAAGTEALDHPIEQLFFPDLARVSGVPCRQDMVDTVAGNTFDAMGRRLLAEPGLPLDTADLLILAHDTPDLLPSKMTGPALSELFPGSPLVLAVTDQGRSAPFTALRLAQGYARRDGIRQALVMVFDQCVMPYEIPLTGPRRVDGDAAAVLVLEQAAGAAETAPGSGYRVRQQCGLGRDEAVRHLARLVAELDPQGRALLLAGAGFDEDWPLPAGARRAPAGLPCTALLGDLAESRRTGPAGPVLLADYEPALGDLSVCWFDGPPAA